MDDLIFGASFSGDKSDTEKWEWWLNTDGAVMCWAKAMIASKAASCRSCTEQKRVVLLWEPTKIWTVKRGQRVKRRVQGCVQWTTGSRSKNHVEHCGNFHKAEYLNLKYCQGSKIPATLNISGFQTCKLPANAQISSKIKLSNLLKTFPKRYSWGKTRKKKKKGSAEFIAMHAYVL